MNERYDNSSDEKRPYIFKLNDKVSFGGLAGVVEHINDDERTYPLVVRYAGITDFFTTDGRLDTAPQFDKLKTLNSRRSNPKKEVRNELTGILQP